MILTAEFIASQPKVTIVVTHPDGWTKTHNAIGGQCGYFAGMVQDAIINPNKKADLDNHCDRIRATWEKPAPNARKRS